MRITTKLAGGAMALGVTAAGLAVSAGPALATSNSDCSPAAYGPMCYYYHSSYTGARAGIVAAVDDLYTWTFSGSSDGNGQAVANNSGSGSNRDTTCTSITWEHVGGSAGGGRSLTLRPYAQSGYQSSTLGALNNNNRSLRWTC